MGIPRILIFAGLGLVALGILWPLLRRIGLGRLPGDIYVRGEHTSFYFPITTCILISAIISAALWLLRR
jgi:hypothetical protein